MSFFFFAVCLHDFRIRSQALVTLHHGIEFHRNITEAAVREDIPQRSEEVGLLLVKRFDRGIEDWQLYKHLVVGLQGHGSRAVAMTTNSAHHKKKTSTLYTQAGSCKMSVLYHHSTRCSGFLSHVKEACSAHRVGCNHALMRYQAHAAYKRMFCVCVCLPVASVTDYRVQHRKTDLPAEEGLVRADLQNREKITCRIHVTFVRCPPALCS